MSKVIITIEDARDGQITVDYEIHKTAEKSSAEAMAGQISRLVEHLCRPQGKTAEEQMRGIPAKDAPRILVPFRH